MFPLRFQAHLDFDTESLSTVSAAACQHSNVQKAQHSHVTADKAWDPSGSIAVFFLHAHMYVTGVLVKVAAWAADRTTSRRILVTLPPFILEEPLIASGWTHTHTHSHTQSRAKVWTHCSLEYDENKQLDVLTPTAGLTRKAFWLLASSCILCTTL